MTKSQTTEDINNKTDEEFVKDHACVIPSCEFVRAGGYVYCNFHLHGRPQKLTENQIKIKETLVTLGYYGKPYSPGRKVVDRDR